MRRTVMRRWRRHIFCSRKTRLYGAVEPHSFRVRSEKRNYENLSVSFDLWKKESDAQPYIPDMVQRMKEEGFAYEDQGLLWWM